MMTMRKLVEWVIEKEKLEGYAYPNLLPGADIRKKAAENNVPLTSEDWVDFHALYQQLMSK